MEESTLSEGDGISTGMLTWRWASRPASKAVPGNCGCSSKDGKLKAGTMATAIAQPHKSGSWESVCLSVPITWKGFCI